jgi:hypothetical protein
MDTDTKMIMPDLTIFSRARDNRAAASAATALTGNDQL